MELNNRIFKLHGKVQNYNWGGKEYIPKLLSKVNKDNMCYAEYWLGAHAKAPSLVETNQGNISLNKIIKNEPIDNLGKKVNEKFQNLPFLFKVLDVKKMLSIQVHPTKKAAELGFEKEQVNGVSLHASNRNYKDKNHKPELMVALSDFWLLHGFLEKEKLVANLKNTKEFNFLIDIFNTGNYYELYEFVMKLSQKEVNRVLKPLFDRIMPLFKENKLAKNTPNYWAAKSYLEFCSKDFDRGIFSIYFFNILNLKKGEAIFQDAGLPHAYLEGENIELMANSDNVLRGGLTQKHIDVDELLKNIKFSATSPKIISKNTNKESVEYIYKTPVKDFELSKINSNSSLVYEAKSKTPEIIFALNGKVKFIQENRNLLIKRGESIYIKANTYYKIKAISKSAELYKAKSKL